MPVDLIAYLREKHARRRAELIELLGGRCVRCGSTDDLEFDHVDRSSKLFEISRGLNRPYTINSIDLTVDRDPTREDMIQADCVVTGEPIRKVGG